MPALEKIILYHTHDIDRKYLQAAYTELAVRDDPITIEEGHLLGLETALRLAHAREVVRAPVFSGKKPGNPHSPINLAGSELDALISRLFNLSLPDATTERPLTPQTPSGRGTPTGGRNTPQLGIHTNGTGSPAPNPARGGSVPQTGPMATQMDSSTAEENKGAGRAAGVPNVLESKGKEAAAAAEVVSDSHRPEPAATESGTGIAETKTPEAQGAPSTPKSVKGQGSARKRETAEQSSSTARPERARAQSEQVAAATTSAEEVRPGRSRSRTAEPTKKEQQIYTTASGPEQRKRDTTPTPTRESSSSSFTAHTHRTPDQYQKQGSSTGTSTTATTGSGLFGFVSTWIGNSGDPGYESSSRESEDDTPMAGAWRPRDSKTRQERERAQAQEATRKRLEAEAAKAAADAEQALKEAEEERMRKAEEERTRKEAEERIRKEADEERYARGWKKDTQGG
ncbi:hypothetical protein BJV77DRAFT_259359 [Russula vinacea]|nr:hypothetical protein BJV77DRAFT_259359 [Russula vinacea]